jgi:hypothetical protein
MYPYTSFRGRLGGQSRRPAIAADQLPDSFPGAQAGVTRMHTKHGIVAGVIGVVLPAVVCGRAEVRVRRSLAGAGLGAEIARRVRPADAA